MAPGWEAHPVSLEELTLAYMREPGSETHPGTDRATVVLPTAARN